MASRKKTVEAAVERDLKQLRLRDSALGAAAVVLAKELDDSDTTAAEKATCTRALIRALERVRELTPSFGDEPKKPTEEKDKVDDLSARRAARRSRSSGT